MNLLKKYLLWVMIALWVGSVFAISRQTSPFRAVQSPIALPQTAFISGGIASGKYVSGWTMLMSIQNTGIQVFVPLKDSAGNNYSTGAGWSITVPWANTNVVFNSGGVLWAVAWFSYALAQSMLNIGSITAQPILDAQAITLRRYSSWQVNNVFEVQTEWNVFLAGIDKNWNFTTTWYIKGIAKDNNDNLYLTGDTTRTLSWSDIYNKNTGLVYTTTPFYIQLWNTLAQVAQSIKWSINSYFEFNIQNTSTGTNASSNIIATMDNWTTWFGFINMWINGSNYTGWMWLSGDWHLMTNTNGRLIMWTMNNKEVSFAQSWTEYMKIHSGWNMTIRPLATNSVYEWNQPLTIYGSTTLPIATGVPKIWALRLWSIWWNNQVLDMWVSQVPPYFAWLQWTDKTNWPQSNPIMLNPNGWDIWVNNRWIISTEVGDAWVVNSMWVLVLKGRTSISNQGWGWVKIQATSWYSYWGGNVVINAGDTPASNSANPAWKVSIQAGSSQYPNVSTAGDVEIRGWVSTYSFSWAGNSWGNVNIYGNGKLWFQLTPNGKLSLWHSGVINAKQSQLYVVGDATNNGWTIQLSSSTADSTVKVWTITVQWYTNTLAPFTMIWGSTTWAHSMSIWWGVAWLWVTSSIGFYTDLNAGVLVWTQRWGFTDVGDFFLWTWLANSKFTYKNTSGFVGINIPTPLVPLHLSGNAIFGTTLGSMTITDGFTQRYGSGIVWKDVVPELYNGSTVWAIPVPVLLSWTTIEMRCFDDGWMTEIMWRFEKPHDATITWWIYPHLHFVGDTTSNNTGMIMFSYSIIEPGQLPSPMITLTWYMAWWIVAWSGRIENINWAIYDSWISLWGAMMFRVWRDADLADDTYPWNMCIQQVWLHYASDIRWSRAPMSR